MNSDANETTAPSETESEGPITLVTGLPRSGTSMVMQMLVAAGVPPLTDGVRQDDIDNPHGYLELEAIKRTASDASWLRQAGGKAAKVIAPLLSHLPAGPEYRVVLIERDLDEVLASQAKMLERSGKKGGEIAPERLKIVFAAQLEKAKQWIQQHASKSVTLSFASAHANPTAAAQAIIELVGSEISADTVAHAVDGSLHRTKSAN